MEVGVGDLNELLNVRGIKMESADNALDTTVEISDSLNMIPQYVTDADFGLLQSSEILQAPLAAFDTGDDEDTMQSSDSSEEVIVHLMDIRTRLSQLRVMLERKLGTDLSDYNFWLQDAKMLESHKTLVEQCIRGAGVVQVNLQIRASERKINILDVLKPDEELVPIAQDQENSGEECPSGPAKWRVYPQFRTEARANLPDDPAQWTVYHVKLWIQWAVRQFKLQGIKLSDWNIGGASLTSMTHSEFTEKVPLDPGDIFWTHFELLRKCKFVAIVQNEEPPKEETFDLTQAAIKKKPKVAVRRTSQMDMTCLHRGGSNGQFQLWQFLLELLTSAEYYDFIRWHGREGEFKLLEPEKVARLWGLKKSKPAMNYEKLSRALRYYYDGDMIAKVPGKRFVYKFVCDLRQVLGYGADELADLVKEAYDNRAKTPANLP